MKYILLLGLALVVLWWIKRNNRLRRRDDSPPVSGATETEAMVRCAHCGTHLPRTEALEDGDNVFCCEQHRQLGKSSRDR